MFRRGRCGPEIRPFADRAEVKCRGYSEPLQRVLADFGAEESFGQAVERVREHYGIEVPESAVRTHTQAHAAVMLAEQEKKRVVELGPEPGLELLITEMDGSLIPMVQTGVNQSGEELTDRRKGRLLHWQEARLCLAREPERVTRRYGACLGSVEEAGEVWADCVIRAGAGAQTHLHCLGDGALWIVGQTAIRFGKQATFVCDFYHVSEYLAAAGKVIAGSQSSVWLRAQQQRLKEDRLDEVLTALIPHQESPELPDEEAPVKACLRYLANRQGQLDYQSALAQGLPIGSGEIESAHRSVIQQRLKIPGAWWLEENAEKMLALRVARANGEWQSYWNHQRQVDA